ncbi:MAG: TRAP transporter small permease [Paraglaciecola sp.]|uniref:TRAP transporter small permease n=1 Tax=Pseudomonadati TaxID=3379134 RepID=UPI00273EFADE|nr:TRAP transporter small permease [Paraglaciecola sp.]MDP5031127.1 TRAP transporter small permease [Paraglaciecola sp.]MDP5132791.1 TRAP transporter small permease [Paraglaciecola sp.]
MLAWLQGGLGKLNFAISHVAKNIAGVLLALMLVMIIAQVVFRYGLNNSLGWTEELAKFFMVWIACLVAPWAYRENLNVSIDMFADALPKVLYQLSNIVISLLVLLVSGIFLMESLDFVQGGWQIYASSLPVKLAYFYLCTPFAFGSIGLVACEKLLEQIPCLFNSPSQRES